jgi:hypothetical protein
MSGVPLWTWLIGALFVAALLHGLWQLQGRKTAFRQIAQELGGSCIENTLTAQVVVPTPVGKVTLDTLPPGREVILPTAQFIRGCACLWSRCSRSNLLC